MPTENYNDENHVSKRIPSEGTLEYSNEQLKKENRRKEILDKLGESYKFKVCGSSYYIEKIIKGEKEDEFWLTDSYKDFRFFEESGNKNEENEKKVYGSKSGNFEDENAYKKAVEFKKFDPSQRD